MGSPISVVTAEIVMQYLESNLLENPPCQLQTWLRYVDDCLTIVPENSANTLLDHFNSFN